MDAKKGQVGGGHYKDMAIQPSEYANANNLGFLEGNVVKYVSRHKSKGGMQDILKAMHYLNMILEWEYKTTFEQQQFNKTINDETHNID
jgi:hypothetical protein